MNYPCNLILDLLPLYHDGICSEESTNIVREHIAECASCSAYYESLRKSDDLPIIISSGDDMEKAASLKSVKRKILHKKILACAISVIVLIAIVFSIIAYMKNTLVVVDYEDNISISEHDGDLIAHLSGNAYTEAKSVVIEVEKDGIIMTNLYFCFQATQWDDTFLPSSVYSEYVIAYKDNGAANINNIYYFTGEYSGISDMTANELSALTKDAVLLWNK